MLETVRQHYPDALPSGEFIASTYKAIAPYGLAPEQIMLAHSICSDDVNAIEYPEEGRQMLGPFNLGGLDGYPFTGLTGMSAFAHHVPDEGAALVFYAPHIGISRSGEPGKILRVGQHSESGCCGAALLGLSRLLNDEIKPGTKPDDDYQQHRLQEFLLEEKKRILQANSPIIEATEVIFENSGKMIDHLIRKTEFTGKYLFVIGAIIINTDADSGSFVQLRRFEEWNNKTGEKIKNLYF